jgi:O-antigen/teichoic acid export membrane protein
MEDTVLYHSLIRNTAVSAFAYFVISVLGIWITGALASNYGLAAFGTITLARLFTVTGLIGVFDMGAPENASHVVARARSTGNWTEAMQAIHWLLLFTFVASLVCTFIMLLLSRMLGPWLGVSHDTENLFWHVLVVSALVFPLCLTSQVAEGISRGFERYAQVRGLEVFTSLAYATGCWIFIKLQQPFLYAIYLFVALTTFRALVAYVLAWRLLRKHVPTIEKRFSKEVGNHMLERTWLVAPNKILSTVQIQSIPLVVGLMVGVAGAGVFDLLMRLPRFAKSALGLLNSAVMPFASRLEAANSQHALRTLSERGVMVIAFLTVPPLFALAVFSKQILHLWVGDALSHYWAWQSFAFSTPLLTVIIGFASLTMFSKSDILKMMTWMVIVRLIIQYIIAVAFIGQLSERAFILGTTVAVLITSVWELKVLLKQDINGTVKRGLISMFALCSLLSIVAFPVTAFVTNVPLLLLGLSVFSLVSWLMVWIFVIPKDFQTRLIGNLKHSFFGSRK